MPEETPHTTFSSLLAAGAARPVTDADVAHVASRGLWAPDGTVDPYAARIGQCLAAALEPGGRTDLLTEELAELVAQVRATALPLVTAVETHDGLGLSAFTLRRRAPGPHPLVILPAAWQPFGWAPFMYAYLTLALKGYHVLAYTPRGLGTRGLPSTSPGFVDLAGPNDLADGLAVLDYAVERFGPSATGFLGVSYGSAIGRLVAAHDPRVHAVVALSSWGDLAGALHGNGVRHVAALDALLALTGGTVEEKFDARSRAALAELRDGTDPDASGAFAAFAARRSPRAHLERTNALGTPTLLSHAWHEALFPVNQAVADFEALTVPKRLNLWIGDHLVPEGRGLLAPPARSGDVNIPMQEAYAWLDHHLKGERNGVEQWPAVSSQVMFTYRTVPVRDPETGRPTGEHRIVAPALREGRPSWREATVRTEPYALTGGGAGGADGALVAGAGAGSGGEAAGGWERSFVAGVDTAATVLDRIVETGRKEWAGDPKVYDTRKIDRVHALVWTTEPLTADRTGAGGGAGTAARRIRGVPVLRLAVRSTTGSASLFAHLFDVAEDETARIITHEPLNVTGLGPGEVRRVEWRLQAAAYDLAEGHRLMLVVDSRDPLYRDVAAVWTQTVVGGPAALELPLG
ncbi:CocE/NonD family hydrolase [Streptomyces sp. NPDC048659]|uniref:CocE/NonD family hydrolase n=1 Tax=Streptomyces sp. NPDC048659 TaxID=3155489 RepID=UPI0034261F5B